GRWQKISDNPLIICDIAHNEAGIAEVLNSINELEVSNLHIVMGMVKDKDIAKVLAILPKQALYYFTQAHTPRALSAEDLRVKALDYNLQGEEFENVNLAIENAKSKASSDDLIVVCGSTFLIAEVEGV
ncbi:MAG: bifunctional folylpolyglutamate synthase/dihydrofolate synthase, partial [Chitinophagaceae bacterium]|nr:bifunctional folylpolyglutamate synthase/dihydrofolate synthase [Chitinophagaceae bacterium]